MQDGENEGKPIRLFFCYSHRDEAFRLRLESHLSALRRTGMIGSWHDRQIGAGTEWRGAIDAHLEEADVVLLLVSADFMASDYCYDIEMAAALRRHEQGATIVIPVMIRPVDVAGTPLAKLQALPTEGRPITVWENEDEALQDVAAGIRNAVERTIGRRLRQGVRKSDTSEARESIAKRVWYLAGGRCAFPHRLELSFPDTGQLFGNVAHIVARSPDGPRGDPSLTQDDLYACRNLILLCPEHHKEVDGNSSSWTVAKLRELKLQHEEWVRRRLKWVEPSQGPQKHGNMLIVLWGASSAGKDVVLNRILMRLQERFLAMKLQRFTTRPRRPEEADDTPFKHLTRDQFFEKVSRGEVACVHTQNDTFYGFDSQFAAQAPPGTILLTCMRQYHYLDELSLRARATGLVVYNILLTADYETVRKRTLLRGTREKEKIDRLKTLEPDVDWFTRNASTDLFDLTVDNSDNSRLNHAVEDVYNFISARADRVR